MSPVMPLGLGFANPLILWGLAAASLPILLHLLNRRRYREERWAAMRFLLAAIRKNQKRIRLEQWLLLAVRVLLIVCLVLAMAQPFLESVGPMPLLASRRTHRVIVLDSSMSMAYSTAQQSRYRQAIQYADAYVQGARRGDAISIVQLGNPPEVVIGAPSPNHDEVREELRQLQPSHGTADLETTLRKLDEVLASAELPQREILFLTDLQATTWRVDAEDESVVQRAAEALDQRRANCVVVDLGEPGRSNHAVVGLGLDAPIVVQGGAPTIITARLARFGSEAEPSVGARLIVDGRLGPEQRVDLPPGQEVPVAFSYTFDEPGDHVVEVRLDEDNLAVDDTRRLAVPVREHLEALLVDGDYDPSAFASETDYLAQALSPSEGTDRTPSPIRVEVVTESQLSRRDLDRFDVVFLCNIARFSPTEAEALDQFLRQGGGVVVFDGDRVQADDYNATLFDDGDGLLPARLGTVVDADASAEPDQLVASAPQFDPMNFEHPIVSLYQGAPPLVLAGLTDVRTWRHRELIVPENSTARVALAFTDGDPAILTRPRHRGVVVQVATTADDDWTSWPLHPSYPPILEQTAFFAASGRMAQRNVVVGQPIDQALPTEAVSAAVTVERPDGRSEPARLRDQSDAAQLVFDQTDLSGVYVARIGPPVARELTFAANPDPTESDLSRADPSDLAALLPDWKFVTWDGGPIDQTVAAGVGRRGEFHRGLLLAVLALLLGETALAWWIGRRR